MLTVAQINGLWMVLHNGKRWSLTYSTRAEAERELEKARHCLSDVEASRRHTRAVVGCDYDPTD